MRSSILSWGLGLHLTDDLLCRLYRSLVWRGEDRVEFKFSGQMLTR
jgi:hypothetical protein